MKTKLIKNVCVVLFVVCFFAILGIDAVARQTPAVLIIFPIAIAMGVCGHIASECEEKEGK